MAANRPNNIEIDTETAEALWEVFAPLASMDCEDAGSTYERSLSPERMSWSDATAEADRNIKRVVVAHSILVHLPYSRISGSVDFAAAASIAAEHLATETTERDRVVRDRDGFGTGPDSGPFLALPAEVDAAENSVRRARIALSTFADLAAREGVPAELTITDEQATAIDRVTDVLWWRTTQGMDGSHNAEEASDRLHKLNALHRVNVMASHGQAPAAFADQYIVKDLMEPWIEDLGEEVRSAVSRGDSADDLARLNEDVAYCRIVLELLRYEVRTSPPLRVIADAIAATEKVAA